MLELRDVDNQLIRSWKLRKADSGYKNIVFSIHTTDVLSVYQDQQAITIFYGFLDQNYAGTAAQFIHSVLLKKGAGGLNACYGSFVVLQYNLNTQKITLSNDALGDFAAHYTINQENNTLHISDLPDLLLDKGNKEINNERLIHYFALSKPQKNANFFKHIKQVNPGQYLTFEHGKINSSYYYQPPQEVNFKNTSSEDLSTQFLELMQAAITYQTQGQAQIGVMMSGGMDSTFVAANALKTNKRVSAFSYVFPTIPDANESLWIDSMRTLDIEMNTFAGESYWPLKQPHPVSINSPLNNPYRNLKEVIYKKAHSKDIKILLSGVFADHLYTGYIYWLIDLFKKRPLHAIKSLFLTMKQSGFTAGLRQVSPKKWSSQITYSAPWLSQQAGQQFKEILAASNQPFKHPHPQQYDLVYSLSTAQNVWLDYEFSYQHGLFVRHPFRDRRVVEFLMSIPAWILGSNQLPKTFVREAAKDLLPESIIRRTIQTTLTPLFIKGVLGKEFPRVKGLLSGSDTSWQNYIQEELVNKLLENSNVANKEIDYMLLWQCVGYEMWQERLRFLV
ncbi:MAG: asparagine synthetase B family protein [Proteobacteria bacterium]|nr:asparagine synthetase B family protein [Pseudomonadota bacterium]